jgi:hypothetical protein
MTRRKRSRRLVFLTVSEAIFDDQFLYSRPRRRCELACCAFPAENLQGEHMSRPQPEPLAVAGESVLSGIVSLCHSSFLTGLPLTVWLHRACDSLDMPATGGVSFASSDFKLHTEYHFPQRIRNSNKILNVSQLPFLVANKAARNFLAVKTCVVKGQTLPPSSQRGSTFSLEREVYFL